MLHAADGEKPRVDVGRVRLALIEVAQEALGTVPEALLLAQGHEPQKPAGATDEHPEVHENGGLRGLVLWACS